MTKGKPKKMGKQAKREVTVQSAGDFCEDSWDGDTNMNSFQNYLDQMIITCYGKLFSVCIILFSSERGMAWVFRGISRGRSPREIQRKTHAILSSDEKSNILFHLTWSNGLELIFQ